MDDSPHIDMVTPLDIEDEVGKSAQPAAPQTRKIEFMGKARGADPGPLANSAKGRLQRAGEGLSHIFPCLDRIMICNLIDVPLGRIAQDDRLHARLAPLSAILLRSRSK